MYPHLSSLYDLSNPDFLAANQRGEITPEQKALLGPAGSKFLKRFQRGSRLNGIAIVLVLALFLVIQALGIQISTPMVLGAFGLLLVVLAAQIGSRWVRSRQMLTALERDLELGQIRDVLGPYQPGKDSARIQVSSQALCLPLGSTAGLTAGSSYRFYYLPGSGMVLSAEAQLDQDEHRELDGLTAALIEANRFHLPALDANRRGKLTRDQLPRLYSMLIAPGIFILAPGGFLAYQFSRPGVIRGTTLSEIGSNLLALNTSTLIMAGILIAVALWGLVLLIRTVVDIAGGEVAVVEEVGIKKTKTTSDEDGTTTTRMYQIGPYNFRVSERGYLVFESGRTYRAYFTPRRKILVNIEVIN